jgi:hypothetical protein
MSAMIKKVRAHPSMARFLLFDYRQRLARREVPWLGTGSLALIFSKLCDAVKQPKLRMGGSDAVVGCG